jgi:hypothetical protein
MDTGPEDDRRSEILRLYQEGTISAEEMEQLLRQTGGAISTPSNSTRRPKGKRRFAVVVVASLLVVGLSVTALLVASNDDSGVSEAQLQSEIDLTKESMTTPTTATSPKSGSDKSQAKDRLERFDACNDELTLTSYRKFIAKDVEELLKPQSSITNLRKNALFVGERLGFYTELESEITSDLLTADAADIAAEAAVVVDTFRMAAAISDGADLEIAFSDGYLQYRDLDRSIETFITTAERICKEY